MIFESAGDDAAASFQRAGYQGCRISPPDLAIAFMAVVRAAQPKLLRRSSREGTGGDSQSQLIPVTKVPENFATSVFGFVRIISQASDIALQPPNFRNRPTDHQQALGSDR
jgi:hypothetical protein